MKNVLFALLQFVLFLAVFAGGSFLPPVHMEEALRVTPDGVRVFIWDGVAMMFLLLLVILLIEARRKRIAVAGPWTAVAFVVAGISGFVMKLGFLTR